MRVIITGQAGTRKAELARRLCEHTLRKRGFNPDAPGQVEACDKECCWFEVEREPWLGADFLNFLANYDETLQEKHWAESLHKILDNIRRKKPKDCFLLVHTTFFRNGRFFSPLSWDQLLLFQPDCVLTLIDDLYDVWQRIEEGEHDTHFSLDEILVWRSVELQNARSLALNLKLNPEIVLDQRKRKPISKAMRQCFGAPIPHFVMSVKHPIETFYRLFFERNQRPLVYASFPISRTRQSPERIEDINYFRKSLIDAGAIVVDPLTIDEFRMVKEDKRWLDLGDYSKFQEYQEGRWKMEDPAVPPPPTHTTPFAKLSSAQIRRTVEGIEQHIVDRDFKLVSQCRQLIAYRPFYPAEGSTRIAKPPTNSSDGVTREINFALGQSKSVWAFHPKSDWCIGQEDSFFNQYQVWSRVRRFPAKSKVDDLPSDDFSGFSELLETLKNSRSST